MTERESTSEGFSEDLFRHESLRDGEIRLLQILPNDADGILRFTLRTMDRRRAPNYVALSYVWGEGTREGLI